MIGNRIADRYQVVSKLGAGAMGEVYLVEHVALGRKEALKVLHASHDDSPDLVARFRREARATNRLQHANIVCVYDFGQLPDGRFFITTEYAEGETLDALLQRAGPFPVPRALHVLAQLAEAIDHAHSRGVIHRDLKPGNMVLVERRGQADVLKVLDFGISKIIAPDYSETMVATREGQVFGTPAYMAPEQVGGQGTDPRMDLYALGCIAHELVVGVPPFAGRTIEVMNAHIVKPPPRASESRREAGIPAELDTIILRLLEKDPDQRIQTGREVAAMLRGVPGFPDEQAGAPRRRPSVAPPQRDTTHSMPAALGIAETLHGNAEDMALGETGHIDPEAARAAVEQAIVQLAESLIDAGYQDPHLSMTVAQVAAVRGTIEGAVARMIELQRAGDEVEQRGREIEGRLSFAIGEMRFDCERMRMTQGRVDYDLEFQLQQLERRHAEVVGERERELAAITDRAIALAAEQGKLEEQLAVLIGRLGTMVDAAAARFGSHPTIDELGHRLARTRIVLQRAQRVPG